MSIEMQRLMLKEVIEQIEQYNNILNKDCSKVSPEASEKLKKVHEILTE